MEGLLPQALDTTPALLLILASFFTAGLTAAAGVGGGLFMLALMTYALPITALIPVHGMVQLGSNISRSVVQRPHIDWAIARQYFAGSLVASFAAVFLVVQLPEAGLRIFLGLFIIAMVWIRFPKITNASPVIVAAGGGATTFLSMFVGVTGPLVAVFLNNLFTEHRKLVATHGITMVIQHALKILVFGIAGFAYLEWIPFVAAMVTSGYLGTRAGTRLMDRIPEQALKLVFRVVLTIAAIDLLRRGLSTL